MTARSASISTPIANQKLADGLDQAKPGPSMFQMREDQVVLAHTFHATVDCFRTMMDQVAEGRAIQKTDVIDAVDFMFPAVAV